MRLRKGHDRFNAHMYRKIKLARSPTCNITAVLKTRRPNIIMLQRCPPLQTARQSVRPTGVQLHTKLYGSKEELEKTATFILKTGLSV